MRRPAGHQQFASMASDFMAAAGGKDGRLVVTPMARPTSREERGGRSGAARAGRAAHAALERADVQSLSTDVDQVPVDAAGTGGAANGRTDFQKRIVIWRL